MTLANSLLLILIIASGIIGLLIVLVHTDFIALKKASNIKTLYSSLVVCLLLFVIVFSVKLLSSDGGKKWLDSFSDSDDCDKIDRPYWCDL